MDTAEISLMCKPCYFIIAYVSLHLPKLYNACRAFYRIVALFYHKIDTIKSFSQVYKAGKNRFIFLFAYKMTGLYISISYNMGKRDLLDIIYLSPRVYISGKSRLPML